MIDRRISQSIQTDLDDKIVILSGPRQSGKTTLSRSLYADFQYLSYDSAHDRALLAKGLWDRGRPLIVFDELHKMPKWKAWLKGVYDTEGVRPRLMVTGSARMNQFKKTGDSLAGRYFSHRLHPLDLRELDLKKPNEKKEAFENLLRFGGFPEPFLKGSQSYYNRWSASHLDIILRQDLLDLESVRDLKSIEVLVSLLAERVGTPVSNASLANHLQKDPKTVAHWLEILEDLFVIFRLTPFHKNLARAIRKEPKYYFYDTARVRGDDSVRYENLVAGALLKETHRLADSDGVKADLYYLRNKDGKEIDFLVHFPDAEKKRPSWLIEVKWADAELSPHFKAFESHFKDSHRLQLVAALKSNRSTAAGHHVTSAPEWLSQLNLVSPI